MKQTYLIINGCNAIIKEFTSTPKNDCFDIAYTWAQNYCDHSKSVYVVKLASVHNTTRLNIPAENVQLFDQK